MLTIDPKEVSVPVFHAYLLGAIVPRPIAFVSSVDKHGNVNLSPFSYFNVFGSNPPTLVFSPSNRVRDNTPKHTLENVLEHDEVVINIVNYQMVAQTSLASTEYPKGTNEFLKAGFTEKASVMVKPPRVSESPASFECKVKKVLRIGEAGGAANLVICEVLLLHLKEEILDEKKQIDPYKLDAVARMGADWYCRAHGDAIFKLQRPNRSIGMGFDLLPDHIKRSKILSGNDLGLLANFEKYPDHEEIQRFKEEPEIREILKKFKNDRESLENQLHQKAKLFIENGALYKAWMTLLLF